MKTLSLSLLLTSFVSSLAVAPNLPEELPKDFVKIRYETETLNKYQLRQVQCLTEALWYEARGETKEGLKAVASVILNRSKSKQFKGSICDVVHQRKQFSYRNSYAAGKPIKISFKQHQEQTYTYISTLAKNAVVGLFKPTLEPSTVMYHADYVKPKWNFKLLSKEVKIGKHTFYKLITW